MADPILDLDNVTVRRGMGLVLENFSLSVSQGECVLLHGDNGIGKSTVIETAARLLPLESGSVRHHGLVVCDGEGRRAKPKHNFGLTLFLVNFTIKQEKAVYYINNKQTISLNNIF